MKLLVAELSTELYQTIRPAKNTQVEAVRVNLYKHNSPSGNFTVEIQDQNGQLVASSSDSFTASELSSSAFMHGFVTFNIDVQMQKEIPYRVVLKASGYSFSESAYIGWCSSYDLNVYSPEYDQSGSFQAPLSLEIWARQ